MRQAVYEFLCKYAIVGNGEAYHLLQAECNFDIKTAKVGDIVMANGSFAYVLKVKKYSPGSHINSPIVNDYEATEVITTFGSRWYGVKPG